MQTSQIVIPYRSRRAEFHLYLIGDIHAGCKHCAEEAIQKQIKEIEADPFALWIGMGDYAEFITIHDPRWDIEVIADWVERSNIAESQYKWVVKLFEPIAKKCVGLLSGNHEESIRQHNQQDVHLDICRDLGVKNLGFSCFVRFIFRRQGGHFTTFIGVFHHGSGGALTEGGKIMRLKRLVDSFHADIYAMGHLHDIKTTTLPYLRLDSNNNIKNRNRVAAITGSWFRTYAEDIVPSYAEKRGYPPTNVGCPVFTIIPDKEIVRVSG